MNTSQNDPNKPGVDEVDDLTRFLDEDFGTDEVDLFEFTGSEDDSALTQLKAIILGLDWEITDESLQDLADEIEQLRTLEKFQHDKVSQVYLQALDKIGNYILTEGAYAHQNAIKLLLTLFYDFEKITSSEVITGAEITALLKSDVRKFKILQYQIAQKHGASVPEATAAAADLPITENKTLLEIHAAILELDWEVTDEGLNGLAEQLDSLKDQYPDNRYIQILINGLSTLNNYINEERARTHPEAFSLLHHFFEALETLVDDKDLDEENTQKLLINCVNRLNTLKALITQTPQELDDEAISPVQEEDTVAPAEDVTETAEEEPEAEEPPQVEEKVAAPVAPVAAAEDDEYEDELDVELPVDEAGEVAPALFDEAEEGGFSGAEEDAEAPPEELEEKLQFFFGDDEDVPPPPPEQEITTEPAADILAEEPVEAEPVVDEPVAEEPVAEIPSEPEATAPVAPPATEDDEYVDELDVELPVDESGEVAPALFDEAEEGGFGINEEEAEAPPEELEEKLQFFFGDDEETFAPDAVEESVAQKKAEEEEIAKEALEKQQEEEEILSVAPALSGEIEEGGFAAEAEDVEAPPEGLEEKLEFFFGEDDQPEPEEPVTVEDEVEAPEIEAVDSLFDEDVSVEAPEIQLEEPGVEDETPGALFDEEGEDDDEELLLTPELTVADSPEVIESAEAETFEAISTQEDYNAALEKIRSEFQEREQSLLDEISALKQELEQLRS